MKKIFILLISFLSISFSSKADDKPRSRKNCFLSLKHCSRVKDGSNDKPGDSCEEWKDECEIYFDPVVKVLKDSEITCKKDEDLKETFEDFKKVLLEKVSSQYGVKELEIDMDDLDLKELEEKHGIKINE